MMGMGNAWHPGVISPPGHSPVVGLLEDGAVAAVSSNSASASTLCTCCGYAVAAPSRFCPQCSTGVTYASYD